MSPSGSDQGDGTAHKRGDGEDLEGQDCRIKAGKQQRGKPPPRGGRDVPSESQRLFGERVITEQFWERAPEESRQNVSLTQIRVSDSSEDDQDGGGYQHGSVVLPSEKRHPTRSVGQSQRR